MGLTTCVGMGIGPILAGPIYDYLGGISPVFFYAGGAGIAGLLAFIILYRRSYSPDDITGKPV